MARQKPAKKAKKKSAGRPATGKAAARRQAQVRPSGVERRKSPPQRLPEGGNQGSEQADAEERHREGAAPKLTARPSPFDARPHPPRRRPSKPSRRSPRRRRRPSRRPACSRPSGSSRRPPSRPASAPPSRRKKKPNLDRPRKTVADVHGIPSSLDLDRRASSAKSGRAEMKDKLVKKQQRRRSHYGG